MKTLLLTFGMFVGMAASAAPCKVTCMAYEYPDGEKGYLWLDMGPLGACPDSQECKQPTYQTDENDFCSADLAGKSIEGVCAPFVDTI